MRETGALPDGDGLAESVTAFKQGFQPTAASE
jgi:hypothetical protein